jgi:hypothetical protein
LSPCLPIAAAPPGAAFLEEHCFDCHDSAVKKGGLDLSALTAADTLVWTKVHDRIASDEMPPAKRPRPAEADKAGFLKALAESVTREEMAQRAKSGRTVYRRLNRTEYEHTLRDLLGLPNLKVRAMLPADGEAHGFDTVGAALNLSYVQMAKYLEAADHALDEAISLHVPSVEIKRVRLQDEGRFYEYDQKTRQRIPGGRGGSRVLDEWIVLLRQPNSAQTPWFFGRHFQHSGNYRVRVRLRGVDFDVDKLRPPSRSHIAALVGHPSKRLIHTFDVPGEARVLEFTTWIEAGEQLTFYAATLDDRVSPGETTIPDKPYRGPGIAVEYVETEGPLAGESTVPRLFGNLPVVAWKSESGMRRPAVTEGLKTLPPMMIESADPAADAQRLLREFMRRTFREAVSEEEVNRYLPLVKRKLEQRFTFHEAMRAGFKAVLCSPDFLFFHEPVGELNEAALATRLSCFLWKSAPDEALRKAKLRDPKVLREQTERLLADPRSQRFVEDFLDQWLELRRIGLTQPDRQLYPEFTMLLQDSMVEETRQFFAAMLRDDLSATHLVSSDFTYANAPLAELYGISGVQGVDLRRVSFPKDSPRGGFLTQGSVLKVTANGTTTSPVTRGAWIMERILGRPVPPPPPGAGSIDPDVRGTTTVREQLEKHRSAESCAGCHRKIDPPGFALESFDVMGAWRDRYRSLEKGDAVKAVFADRPVKYKLGPAVDATGQSEDGKPFRDIREFRALLIEDQRQLARNLTERLLVYATGAGISFADRAEVERIVTATTKSNHGVRSLIHAVVQSRLFTNK